MTRRLLLVTTILAAALVAPAQADVVRFGATGAGDGIRPGYGGGLAVDAAGNVYAVDPDPANRVLKFGPTLAFERTWGYMGSADGEFNLPRGLAITGSGDVVVGEANVGSNPSARLQTFTGLGVFVGSRPTIQVSDLAVDAAGNRYVASSTAVVKYDASGTVLASWSGGGYLGGITVDAAHGEVVIADANANRIRVFDLDLNPVRTWGTMGGNPGQLLHPGDVAVVGDDVYVSQCGCVGNNPGIQRFTRAGVYRGAYMPGQVSSLATDMSGRIYAAGYTSLVRIAPDLPVAALSAPVAAPGAPVVLDASGSFAPFSSIESFAWDLDGDGSFERTTGVAARTAVTFTQPGSHRVAVRATTGGISDTATAVVAVVAPAAPGGGTSPEPSRPNVGVSINAGALFTNTPSITLAVTPPAHARWMYVSNDGGFVGARRVAASGRARWTLASTGPERLPKTVYVRFDSTGSQTFTDDIVLDETPPAVASATLDATTRPARMSARRTLRRLRLRASDRTSGVSGVQYTTDKRRPGALRPYARSLRVAGSPRWVRVRDGAGNVSSWRRIRLA